VPVPITILMLQRCIEQASSQQDIHLRKKWKPLSELSPNLQLAVVCSEDQNFLTHNGFDFEAIDKAIEHNEKQKNKKHPRMRGASTISQQTAKNVFLWPGRTWVRKGLEVYFTVLIEFFWSKERILEVYLNVIEWGNGVYGAEMAAQSSLGKSASKLSPIEAGLMASVLPNPRKYSLSAPGPFIRKRANWVARQMQLWGGKLNWENPQSSKEKEK